MVDMIPGDPVARLVGIEGYGEQVAKRRQQMGLDRPVGVRLVDWMGNALRGDFGDSYFLEKGVTEVIVDRYPVTISLALFGLVVAVVLGVLAGSIAAVNQGKIIDWLVTTSSLAWLSLPGFMVGLGMIYLFSVRLGWFPIAGSGRFSLVDDPVDALWRLFLPGLSLGLTYAGVIARFTRTSLLEVLKTEYIVTARSKGLHERVVLLQHALRNSLIPILTVIGIGFGDLLGGAVITETVFTISGVGRMILSGVLKRDYPIVQGGVFVLTATYLLVNLLVDLLYGWADPRIRLE
jgi:peptide/nickel transport system permease protein